MFTPVDRASRWEFTHIHSDLIRPHGQVAWVPEPVDWKLMSEVNVRNMAGGCRHLMVHVDSIPGLYKFVFDHEHNGVKVWSPINEELAVKFLVRVVPPSLIVEVSVKAWSDCVEVRCADMHREHMWSDFYDLDREVTVGVVRNDMIESLMMNRSISRYTQVHFFRQGSVQPLSSRVHLWSSQWRFVNLPVTRRVVGKQAATRQMTLDAFFNRPAAPRPVAQPDDETN